MITAFDPGDDLVIITAQVHGPMADTVVRLALDTGAVGTVINPAILIAIGYDLSQAVGHIRIVTASGIETASRLVLSRLMALEQSYTDFLVTCHTLPPATGVDGLLGLDFIRRQRLVIDFRTGQITLT